MRFSTHAKKGLGKNSVNEPELWRKTDDMVRQVLIDSKINYVEVLNEAAFYGPKIDVQVWRCLRTPTNRPRIHAGDQVRAGRAGTSPCPLVAVRKHFGLTYRDRDNTNKTPLCIHRAPLGTHERFIGFLVDITLEISRCGLPRNKAS